MSNISSPYIPPLSDDIIKKVLEALALTNQAAFQNVTHNDSGKSILDADGNVLEGEFSRGGPFGAVVAIILEDGTFELIGAPKGNNVVGSGVASQHAEDQASQPDDYGILVQRLTELKREGHNPTVLMISSGQSCTTCHTKQEIWARDLVATKLINLGYFITIYGATYDATFKIAQFYDRQYAAAMAFFAKNPNHPLNLIHHEAIKFRNAPFAVRKIINKASSPTAVVMRPPKPGSRSSNDRVYVVGKESRTKNDLFSTAEVTAIRAACFKNRKEGTFASWEVDGTMYTTASEIGPLLFAEAGWTHINRIVYVKMPSAFRRHKLDMRETPEISNTQFLKTVAGGYRDKGAFVRVVRDESFDNSAQYEWQRILKQKGLQLYNGSAVARLIELEMSAQTRRDFAAFDIRKFADAAACSCDTHKHNWPLRLLNKTTGQLDKDSANRYSRSARPAHRGARISPAAARSQSTTSTLPCPRMTLTAKVSPQLVLSR